MTYLFIYYYFLLYKYFLFFYFILKQNITFLFFPLPFFYSFIKTKIALQQQMITTDDVPLNNESCELMDGFAIFIQLSLFFTALLTLIYKRSTETPQRPLQIWYLRKKKKKITKIYIIFFFTDANKKGHLMSVNNL